MTEDHEKPFDASKGISKQFKHQKTRKLTKRFLVIVKDVLLLAFAIVGLINMLQPSTDPQHRKAHSHPHHAGGHHMTPPDTRSCNCGNSIAEAVKLGCKFDSLAVAWLPEHCRDEDLTAEFERSGPGENGEWEYWADTNHTQQLTLEEVAATADYHHKLKIHMTRQWHVLHCIFYWRKEHRARFNGKKVEPRADTEGHIQHCSQVILDPGYGTVAGVVLNTDEDK